MKRVFTTNWHRHRTCAHPISKLKLQHHTSEKVSTAESLRPRGFKKILLKAIDEGLSSIGDSPKQAIYLHLEKTFKIKRQDIPNKIEEFSEAMEKIFGPGAKVLEIQIMRHLYEKVGQDFRYVPNRGDLVFNEYVEAVRYHVVTSQDLGTNPSTPRFQSVYAER